MNTLSKAIAIASLVTAGALTSQAANAEVSFNASLVTDYVFRGFSFSDEGPALQGGADYSHESGAYVGTWLSTVDDGIDTDIEYDLYAGYWMEVGGLEVDLGYTTYSFIDAGFDTAEVYANVTKGAFTGSVYLDIDAYETTYVAGAYSMELPQDLTLDLAAGILLDTGDINGDDVIDMSASVSKTISDIDIAFTVTNVDIDFGQEQTIFFLSATKEF
jgi:uncharacterized protein (TIGR02001 family)